MKILLISFGFQEYVVSLVNSLSNNDEVTLCVPDNLSNNQPFSKLSKKVKLEKFNLPKIWDPKIVRLNIDLIRIKKKFSPDIVHFQESGHPILLPFFMYLNHCGIPIVNTLHDIKPHLGEENIQKHFLDWQISFFVMKYIVHGNFLKKELSNYMKIPLSDIAVIPHGNFSIYNEWKKKDFKSEKNTFLFFGRIHEYKGLDILLESLIKIKKKIKSFKLIIAGKMYNINRYQKGIKENSDLIELHDYRIPHSKVCELFQRASVVILPYKEASQSGVVPLAFAFGKPVIVTDVGSVPEVVDEGIDGFIVPPNDPDKLAQSILNIFKANNIQRMSRNAYVKSKTKLSWGTISKLTKKVYIQSLLKNKSKN